MRGHRTANMEARDTFATIIFLTIHKFWVHYNVIMSAMASQITSLMIDYSSVYSGADKKKSKLRVTGFCEGNSPVISEFSAQRASNAEHVSIWWRRHVKKVTVYAYSVCCCVAPWVRKNITPPPPPPLQTHTHTHIHIYTHKDTQIALIC